MCNNCCVALPKRKCGKNLNQNLINSSNLANIYACELGPHPSVNFLTNKVSADKYWESGQSLDSIQ